MRGWGKCPEASAPRYVTSCGALGARENAPLLKWNTRDGELSSDGQEKETAFRLFLRYTGQGRHVKDCLDFGTAAIAL